MFGPCMKMAGRPACWDGTPKRNKPTLCELKFSGCWATDLWSRRHEGQRVETVPRTTQRVAGRDAGAVGLDPGPSPGFGVGQGVGAVRDQAQQALFTRGPGPAGVAPGCWPTSFSREAPTVWSSGPGARQSWEALVAEPMIDAPQQTWESGMVMGNTPSYAAVAGVSRRPREEARVLRKSPCRYLGHR